jgi:hypothetical protein
MSVEERNMELMQTLDDAWNAQDVEVFRQRHKPDVVKELHAPSEVLLCEASVLPYAFIHPSAWRNCLENSRRLLDQPPLPPKKHGREAFDPSGSPIQDPFRISKQFRSGCMKSPQTRASRLVMRRIMAAYTNASRLAQSLS